MHPPIPSRYELQQTWQARVQAARQRYQEESEALCSILKELEENSHDRESIVAFTKARCRESEALLEYRRVLQIFTDLVISGKVPEEAPDGQ